MGGVNLKNRQNIVLPTSPPGDIIQIALENNGLTQAQLVKHIGLPIEHMDATLASTRPITPDVATMLGGFFGTGDGLWLRLQEGYNEEHPELSLSNRMAETQTETSNPH